MVVKEEGNTEDKVSLEFSCAEIELCLTKSGHGRTQGVWGVGEVHT